MNITDNTAQLAGNTPLYELKNIEKKYGLKNRLFAKLEFMNYSGSIKDRIAVTLIDSAEKSGKLKKGGTIIEPTSGNTGIALCAAGVPKGYRVIIVMPENMSEERKKIIKLLGGELVLTPAALSVPGAVERAEEIHRETEGSIIAGQFENAANTEAHYKTTGPEIYEALDGKVDFFTNGIGTGGTLTGVGQYLKHMNPNTKIIALEPENASILDPSAPPPSPDHRIEGIGDGIIPPILDTDIIDGINIINDGIAIKRAREIAKEEGLLVGISSGANLESMLKIALDETLTGKNIVTVFSDSALRYFSTDLFC